MYIIKCEKCEEKNELNDKMKGKEIKCHICSEIIQNGEKIRTSDRQIKEMLDKEPKKKKISISNELNWNNVWKVIGLMFIFVIVVLTLAILPFLDNEIINEIINNIGPLIPYFIGGLLIGSIIGSIIALLKRKSAEQLVHFVLSCKIICWVVAIIVIIFCFLL